MTRAFGIFASTALALTSPIFISTGCGGGEETRVVTRTVTEAAAVEPDSAPQVSPADAAWAALVRRQNQQLTDVARRAQGMSNSYEFWQVSTEVISRAEYEISTTSTAGLSPCMADVPSKWEAVLTGFAIGAAAGTGSTPVALRDQVLATVASCIDPARIGGPATGGDVAGTSEQDKADAEAACLRVGAGRGSFKCATWVIGRAGSDTAKYPSLAEEWTIPGD